MTEKIIKPIPITKNNFSQFGDMISTSEIKPIEINNGYAKRYDGIANLNTSKDNGETTISIFSALPKCSLLHAIGTAPFTTDVRFCIFFSNFFLIFIEP